MAEPSYSGGMLSTREMEASAKNRATTRDPPTEEYHRTEFWKKVPVGAVTCMDAKIVSAATKDLCHAILLEESAPVVMEKAAKLAAQFRKPKNLAELLVDHAEFSQFFALDASVRLDLTVPEEGERRRYSKWYQRWKNEFISSIDALNEKQALGFGPAFAYLLLRLGRRSIRGVAHKMTQLLRILDRNSYPRCSYVNIPPEKKIISLLMKYAGAKPKKILVNTVFGGLMWAYHKQYTGPGNFECEMRGMLDFLALQSMKFSGMPLVSLIDEILGFGWSGVRPVYFDQIWKHFRQSCTTYITVALEFGFNVKKPEEFDCFYCYAREFSDNVFRQLSYEQNHRLCNVNAVLIDMRRRGSSGLEWPTVGPRYQWLVKIRPNSLKLTRDDFDLAKSLFD